MLHLYNSLTKKTETFNPINPPKVGVYTCGPTVYDYVHIGNFRTYTTSDLLLRTLKYNGYSVSYIMNITDVGHLTGDNLGDADIGEDRMEKASKKEGKSAWDIARYYEDAFKKDFDTLNLIRPKLFTRATEHIKEQIMLVKKLEQKGYTYKTSDGIYFDTSKFPDYGKLSPPDPSGLREGARVAKNLEKKNATDFALWKFSPKDKRRQMEWESPWGVGFPGWHIECSAMSMKYLGETFDIHVGGEDLAAIHHPNEIAQSEAATGKPFVHYFIHGAFMLVDGQRMSKSLGNNFRLSQLFEKGFNPMALRYLYLQTHYRAKMNFTWEALEAAKHAVDRLYETVSQYRQNEDKGKRTVLSEEKLYKVDQFNQQFKNAVNDDLNMPQALSVLWAVMKSNIPSRDKYDLAMTFDEVFGLRLLEAKGKKIDLSRLPEDIKDLVGQREAYRREGKWKESDAIRTKIEKKGFRLEDTSAGPVVYRS